MDPKAFREKYLNGNYLGFNLELQMETNLIDVPEYPYRENYATCIGSSGQSCIPMIVQVPLKNIYGNGWLFGPKDNANPIPSMLAYWFEQIRNAGAFPPLPNACETITGEYFVRNADHRILMAYILGMETIPLEVICKNMQIEKRNSNPIREFKEVKRYSM